MKNKTKNELKTIAQRALKVEYGFAPCKTDIILLEAYGDGTYILFEVSGNEYSFNSSLASDGSVLCYKGTISRVED